MPDAEGALGGSRRSVSIIAELATVHKLPVNGYDKLLGHDPASVENVMNSSSLDSKNQKAYEGRLVTSGKKRTRTGCLNCRRKRRKCDEAKPICEGCVTRQEQCRYGLRLTFRPENAQTMRRDHPSMQRSDMSDGTSLSFQIVDVTSEVIRDCIDGPRTESGENGWARPCLNEAERNTHDIRSYEPRQLPGPHDAQTDNASPDPAHASPLRCTTPGIDLFLSPGISESTSEDGIFVPGSQYHELYAALRSRIIDTARSAKASPLAGTPAAEEPGDLAGPAAGGSSLVDDEDESRRLADLSPEQELRLWENYMHEVADWLDKFDNARSFGFRLPVLAKAHAHLRCALLALSARQLELKARGNGGGDDHTCSLALYQRAIHLLSPLLQQRTTAVLASCLVLCVLEMLSCAPKAWKRHLDGCAALIQALGICGASAGRLERALFWCFARMDVCGALISCERTLIPPDRWVGGGDLAGDVAALMALDGSFDVYANHVVYLCARVVELLCASGRWEPRAGQRAAGASATMSARELAQRWSALFCLLDQWYQERPEEMKPLMSIRSPPGKPFPMLLFGNGPAVSGNQMYHTAALLMLKHKPSSVQFARKPHSVLWHARQICGISMSNSHHGCWTNSVQPLWIAGQHMSHASEHRAIIDIYERIERETGWATRWRQKDLREYWGDDADDGIFVGEEE